MGLDDSDARGAPIGVGGAGTALPAVSAGRPARGSLPPIASVRSDVRHWWRLAVQRAVSYRRQVGRKWWPGAPSTTALWVIAAVVVAVPFGLTYAAHLGWWSWTEDTCKAHSLGCGLGTHLVGTALVAALAYYLVFLRREARAAKSWRRTVEREPEQLFSDWLPNPAGLSGLAARTKANVRQSKGILARDPSMPPIAGTAVGRTDLVHAIAAELNETGDAQVIVGESGSGKTTVLMALAAYLSDHGQVAVAISMRDVSSGDLEQEARDAFTHTVTGTSFGSQSAFKRARARDHEQAEKWWNWLRRRQLITVIADDLEKSSLNMADRVRAIEQASHHNLRLVVASRGYGLPTTFSRGRTDLPPLETSEIVEDLSQIVGDSGGSGDRPSDGDAIARIVSGAHIERTPYYLAIARVLADAGKLPCPGDGEDPRIALLDRYHEELADGSLAPEAGMREATRRVVLQRLELIAFVRLLGIKPEGELRKRAERLEPPVKGQMALPEAIELARRLAILETRYDGRVHFAHPTTLAYFASRFIRVRQYSNSWKRELIEATKDASTGTTRFSSNQALCLTLANAAAQDPRLVSWSCEALLKALTQDSNGASADESFARAYDRLSLCASMAEMLAAVPDRDRVLIDQVAETARQQSAYGGRLIAEKQRVVEALAALDAYDNLWTYATERQEYPVRREAVKRLVDKRGSAEVLIPKLESAIVAAEKVAAGEPRHADDRLEEIDHLKPAAWILPSLRHAPAITSSDEQRLLNTLQARLVKLALGEHLTLQRGLEASTAQGFKLDAINHPDADDEFPLAMLDGGELPDGGDLPGDDELPDGGELSAGGAKFWFSRVLLLQTVTMRCIAGHLRKPEMRQEVLDRLHDVSGDNGEHPFVRVGAQLCQRAIVTGPWEKYIWLDMTEVVTRAPHDLSTEAAQLVGDMVIALNLNGHEEKEWRHVFGRTTELPACLARAEHRGTLLGKNVPPGDCPLMTRAAGSDGAPDPGSEPRCECPYLYHSADLNMDTRRELSRAFCRHQRMNARPLPWQSGLSVTALEEFWEGMERLARF